MRLKPAINDFLLQTVEKNCTKGTQKGYVTACDQIFKCNHKDFKTFMDNVKKRLSKYKPSTLRWKILVLHGVMEKAAERGDVPENWKKFAPIMPVYSPSTLPKAIDSKTIMKNIEHGMGYAWDDYNRSTRNSPSHLWAMERAQITTILAVLYSTGARISEVLGLKLQDIFNYEETMKQNKLVFQELIYSIGKGNQEFPLFFSNTAKKAIRRYILIAFTEMDFSNLDTYMPKPLFFVVKYRGGIIDYDKIAHPSTIYHRLKVTYKCHPHQLRHSAAIHLVQRGTDLETLRKFLHHKSLRYISVYLRTTAQDIKNTVTNNHPMFREEDKINWDWRMVAS